jgi:L-ribulokinase
MQLAGSSQACALGSAVSAAVLAGPSKGGHKDFATAQKAMTSVKTQSYSPIAENRKVYDELYHVYRQLHDAFGGISKSADLSGVMKTLIRIREAQSQ